MALQMANRVKDFTNTIGTGTVTLLTTPPAGFNQFNGSITTTNTCKYCIVDGDNYEIGIGTFTEPDQLARTTRTETKVSGVIDITNPSPISLSGNTAEVFITDTPISGTFVPTIIGSSSAGTGTYSTQQGGYAVLGNILTFYMRLIWSAHTGTGNYTVGTIPTFFPAQALPCTLWLSNITYSGALSALVSTNGVATIYTTASNAAATGLAMDADYTATPQSIYLSGSYPIA